MTKIAKRALALTKTQLAEEQKLDSMIAGIPDATGIKNPDIASRIVCQVGESLLSSNPQTADSRLIKAIGALSEVGPHNGTEAMLSAQMIAAHEAAIHFTKLGASQARLEAIEVCARQATRFRRVFNEQLESMQKLKGKTGQQKVTVEHVHVNEGGQAIVGALIAPGGGMSRKTVEIPHGQWHGWLRNGNPPGDFSKAPRCGAKNRRGTPMPVSRDAE